MTAEEIKYDLDVARGEATLPLADYNDMRDEIRRLQELCDTLRNENTSLRMMFAGLKLPSPDTIENDTIETYEQDYVSYGDPLSQPGKRRRIIKFTYHISPQGT